MNPPCKARQVQREGVANAKARADDSVLRVASVSFLFQCAALDSFYEIGAAVAHLTSPFYTWFLTMVSPLVKFGTSTWIYAGWKGKVYLKQIPKDFVMYWRVWESITIPTFASTLAMGHMQGNRTRDS
ncbi:MAG: hypothetical protein OEV27_10215 [Nitrospira sp.]|nr:hypothetical protein [Nitrospira sp.]MDH5337027.1 hypothetical protein [Nitrospira sp.]